MLSISSVRADHAVERTLRKIQEILNVKYDEIALLVDRLSSSAIDFNILKSKIVLRIMSNDN